MQANYPHLPRTSCVAATANLRFTHGLRILAGALLVLLLASINYQLNLGYVLTFLLAGSGVVSMHLTHATLRGLTLRLGIEALERFVAGEPLHRDEIVKRVLKSRHVKETTILLNLQGKPQFKRVAKATYALAE